MYWIRKYDAVNNGYNSNDNWGKIGGDTLTGHPNFEEISKKISVSKIGSKNPNAKRVRAVNVISEEFTIYNSFSECQLDLNIPRHDIISKRCRGIIKKPYNNIWMFEYID